MKSHYDFSNGRKNPYAKKLKDEGYSILINYNPKGTENGDDAEQIDLKPNDTASLDDHRSPKAHGE